MGRKKKEAVISAAKTDGPVVYIGPTFKDSVLNTFMVFASGIPEQYAQDPIYKHLFVVPEKLNDARKEVGSKGSLLYIMYHRALAQHAKKKE